MSEKVEKLAKDVAKLAPAGQELVKTVLHASMEESNKAYDALDNTSIALTASEALVTRLSGQLDDMKDQKKDLSEMLTSIYENDDELARLDHEVEKTMKGVKTRKTEISRSQQALELKAKIADLNEDIKMVQESISTHLINIFQITGSRSIDISEGESRDFDIRAKMKGRVAPRSSKNRQAPGQTNMFDGVESVTIQNSEGSVTISKPEAEPYE